MRRVLLVPYLVEIGIVIQVLPIALPVADEPCYSCIIRTFDNRDTVDHGEGVSRECRVRDLALGAEERGWRAVCWERRAFGWQ